MFVLKEMFFISRDFFFTMDKFATIWEDLNFLNYIFPEMTNKDTVKSNPGQFLINFYPQEEKKRFLLGNISFILIGPRFTMHVTV
jgi:hypothetical protein